MRDLRDFYDPDLHATINGHRFTVKCPSAADGIRLRAMMADPDRASKASELETINGLFRGDDLPAEPDVLPTGGLWDELAAADVTLPEMLHLGMTAIFYFGMSEEAAVNFWESARDNDRTDEEVAAAESAQAAEDGEGEGGQGKAGKPRKKTTARKKTARKTAA